MLNNIIIQGKSRVYKDIQRKIKVLFVCHGRKLLFRKNAGKSRVSAFGCNKIYSWSMGFDQDLTNFWHSQKKRVKC